MHTQSLFLASALVLLNACGSPTNAPQSPTPTANSQLPTPVVLPTVPDSLAGMPTDSLLLKVVTYIHKRPTAAINVDRSDASFAAYYRSQLPNYRWIYHVSDSTGEHRFYLLRPARSVSGNTRGVLGRFRLDGAQRITYFEEVANTPIADTTALLLAGDRLFRTLNSTGNVDLLLKDGALVEWPDERLYYDTDMREWRTVGAPKAP